jgi:hypothetical protein
MVKEWYESCEFIREMQACFCRISISSLDIGMQHTGQALHVAARAL